MNYQHLGGRLFSYLNDSLLLSTGDMGHVNLSGGELYFWENYWPY